MYYGDNVIKLGQFIENLSGSSRIARAFKLLQIWFRLFKTSIMFTKIFVFALLTAYAASNKTNTIEKYDSIDGWWKDLQQSFQEYYEQSKRAFEDTLNEVKRRASHAIQVSKDKFSELKEGYNELRESNKTEENKNNTWKNHIEGLKLQSLETLKSINKKYEQLKEKTEKVIKSQQDIWQAKIKELLEDIRKFDEVEKEDK